MLVSKPFPKLISVVIPIYNEEESLPFLIKELKLAIPLWQCPVELILVDDGSTDKSYSVINDWATEESWVKTISMSRNFGHQLAVTAGLDASNGDAVVIMDADLQDPPSLISEFIKGYCEGYDVVYGQRTERLGENFFKLLTARLFYWLMRRFVDPNLPENVGDFRLISQKVACDLRKMPEHQRFLRGMISWVGYNQKAIPYVRQSRSAGTTKYPFFKMLRLAINAATSFSDVPLRAITWIGLASICISIFLIIRTVLLYFLSTEPLVLGWASLSVMISFFSGLILSSMGILGLYIGRIYSEVQGRPLYLIRHSTNLENVATR
jgi:glycosyltransferase involved in cell wall biosynthesis